MSILKKFTVSGVAKIALVAALMALPFSHANAEPKKKLRAGVLTCHGGGGWGAIITSKKEFNCTFSTSKGVKRDRYRAVIHKYGLDIGVTGNTTIQWAVLAPSDKIGQKFVNGSMQGTYGGAGVEAAVGIGLGANALLGGGGNSFALQPLSVQASSGANLAGGVQTLKLTYIGPAQ